MEGAAVVAVTESAVLSYIRCINISSKPLLPAIIRLIGSVSGSSFGVHQVKLTKVAYGFLQTGTRGY